MAVLDNMVESERRRGRMRLTIIDDFKRGGYKENMAGTRSIRETAVEDGRDLQISKAYKNK